MNMDLQTINDLFIQAVERTKKPAALMYKKECKYHAVSSLELYEKVKQATAGLVQLGINKGDRIGLLSENRPEWAISDLAILAVGAINVPIYPSLPSTQLEYILNDAGVRALIVSNAQQLEKVLPVLGQIPTLSILIVLEGASRSDARILEFQTLLNLGQSALEADRFLYEDSCEQVKGEDLASIIYTSGTTGTPKGVMLSHSNIVSNVLACADVFRIDDTDIALSFLPLCHIFERTVDYLMIYCGATIAYAETAETVPQNMLEVRPTIVASVPRLFEKMYARIMEAIDKSSSNKKNLTRWALRVGKKQSQLILANRPIPAGLKLSHRLASLLVFSKLQAKLGGRLRYFISGGAPLDKNLAEFFHGVGVLILEGYGLTETSPVIAVNRIESFKFGTVGKPIPNVEVKISDDGEILTRSSSVMIGYYGRQQDTADAIQGGWFHTGDIGHLDQDGFLQITDRKKDLIVTASGKNVAPQKIEGFLKTSPFFLNAIAIGDRRAYLSALVIPVPDKIITYAKERNLYFNNYSELVSSPLIRDFLMEQINLLTRDLAPFEQVKKIVVLENDFTIESGELTPTMKVRRRAIESKYKVLIDKMYAKDYQPA
jgi:long-chain acyl-CoA synthetase